jgi:hypothetical protein
MHKQQEEAVAATAAARVHSRPSITSTEKARVTRQPAQINANSDPGCKIFKLYALFVCTTQQTLLT